MGFNCGIIGLPNVGKSTIFNAMTAAGAEASNYPFCTIDPNVGMVALSDERLERIAGLVRPQKVVPTSVEFVDIAGLVRGASRGEGLGNQFLGHIRSVDMVAHIVRCFEDPNVVHVDGRVDPAGDIDVIETELMLADLETVTRRLERTAKLAKTGDKEAKGLVEVYEAVKARLEEGRLVRGMGEAPLEAVRDLHLITAKPVLYVANVSEEDLDGHSEAARAVRERAEREGAGFVVICGKLEGELAELPEEEKGEFLADVGLEEPGLARLARKAYAMLGLITFFTAGPKEVRAWTVVDGATAPRAGGVIHSDFERGFIRAEVISCDDFVACGGEAACRERGLVRLEGKDYRVRDGDIIHFRFAV
ncbi:MAG TPA: redox-regulated ATPase YchF [Deltaproteobacteria bacterium]|nr:redox-regulated ATPase YchF [Deltaproteobacteria bacterium]